MVTEIQGDMSTVEKPRTQLCSRLAGLASGQMLGLGQLCGSGNPAFPSQKQLQHFPLSKEDCQCVWDPVSIASLDPQDALHGVSREQLWGVRFPGF